VTPRFLRVIAASLALGLGACAQVEPWERGRLAKPHMALEPTPSQRELRSHVYLSREAAMPAGATDGGGCGCY
jgi:hypothetical protein